MTQEQERLPFIDKDNELYRALRGRLLRRSHTLLLDAFQKDKQAIHDAIASGSHLINRYVVEDPLATPAEDNRSILLTPRGENLLPDSVDPHFLLYFAYNSVLDDPNSRLDRLWIRPVNNRLSSEIIVVNETDVYAYGQVAIGMTNEVGTAVGTDSAPLDFSLPPTIPYETLFTVLTDLKSYRLAPQTSSVFSPGMA